MFDRLALFLGLLGLVGPMAVGAPSAQATPITNGSLTIDVQDQYLLRDCQDYLFPFSVQGTDQPWNLNIDVRDAGGSSDSIGFEYGTGPVSSTADVQMCEHVHGVGAYDVVAVLTVNTDTSQQLTYTVTSRWNLLKTPSRTSLTLSKSVVKAGGIVRFWGRVVGTTGPNAGRPGSSRVKAVFRYKGRAAWHTLATGYVNSTGRYSGYMRPSKNHRRVVVFVKTQYLGDEVMGRSTSPVRRLRIVR